MTRRPLGLALILSVILPSSAHADDEANRSRLRSLPLRERRRLEDRLKTYESLDPLERGSIQDLNAKLENLPEAERENYLGVLRRYSVWLNGLSDADRAAINAAPPATRMSVVSRVMAEQKEQAAPFPLIFLAADFGGSSPFDLADRIKVWMALDATQKAELNRLQEPARGRRLQELGRSLDVTLVSRISQAQEDRAFDRATRSALFPMLKRPEELVKVGRLKQRLAESAYFAENPPAKVSPDNLLRFVDALPVWMRSFLDPLSPEDARRRLAVLYRLVYPAPAEVPAPAPPAPGPGKAATRPGTPPPRPSGPETPF